MNWTSPSPSRISRSGIIDDVTKLSLATPDDFEIEPEDVFRAVFFGLGADGTVGANKNSIKIIGEETDFNTQGYFVYDSKKSGAITISHLRFGPRPIRSAYLIRQANFVACHPFKFLERFDIVGIAGRRRASAAQRARSRPMRYGISCRAKCSSKSSSRSSRYMSSMPTRGPRGGHGRRINTVMQTCFFAISGVLPREQAIEKIKKSIQKTYAQKGRGGRPEEFRRRGWHAGASARD